MSLDRLALLDDPSHEILDLRADSKFRSGQGSGNRKLKRFGPELFILSFLFQETQRNAIGFTLSNFLNNTYELIFLERRTYLMTYVQFQLIIRKITLSISLIFVQTVR
jgi:hypothetical protein